jgi:hypothetical protein
MTFMYFFWETERFPRNVLNNFLITMCMHEEKTFWLTENRAAEIQLRSTSHKNPHSQTHSTCYTDFYGMCLKTQSLTFSEPLFTRKL